ncbi:hypothetical protein [Planctomicrobium sp. SH527]|uniref:hypothetical protein n=1 Tax=Planctomicrobium sp. SH527 TaxID=3448123 RepID=UPI003F5B1243
MCLVHNHYHFTEDLIMERYIEQTAWLMNPSPDGRKPGRYAKQCWLPGTRWIYDDSKGTVMGESMVADGELAKMIVAHSKEVEPGFGAIVNHYNFAEVIAKLIDKGKVMLADIEDVLYEENLDEDEEDEGEGEDDEVPLEKRLHEKEIYRYRHWLSLDPPNEERARKAAEYDHRKATIDEFKRRTSGSGISSSPGDF